MATDYDAPRRRAEDDLESDSLAGLKPQNENTDIDDDGEIVESYELAPEDFSGEDLNVQVVPRRSNEFTCSICFLVQSNKRISHHEDDGSPVCLDCA